jgi:hypothetical protein
MAEEIKIVASAVGFDQVQKGLNNTTTALKTTADQAQKTGTALTSSLKPGAGQATQSLTNLSRIAQDAPFGFIAIQNNISPLIESFGRLKAETGTTGGALKSLVGSLAGPAGLGLAVSVGTALLTTFASKMGKSKEETDAFTKSLNSAKQSATTTAVNLQSLIKVAQDETKSNEQRNEALNRANKIMGDYGEKLTLANIATEKITKQTELFTQALIAEAIAAKYADKVAELTIKQAEARLALAKNEQFLAKIRKQVAGEQVNLNTGTTKSSSLLAIAQGNVVKEQENLNEATRQLNETTRLLNESQNTATQNFGDIGKKAKGSAKEIETVESVLAKLRKNLEDENLLASILGTPRFDLIQKDFSLVEGAITTLIQKFNLTPSDNRLLKLQIQISNLKSALTPAEVKKFAVKTKEDLQKGLFNELKDIKVLPDIPVRFEVENLNKAVIELGEKTSESVENIANDIAFAFGDTLGKAMTGEATFGDFFKSIFAVIGAGLQDLGKQFVIAAGLFAQIKKTLALKPELALIAGLALIAVGGVIRSLSSRNAFAVGTRNAPGGMALVGERGPELVNLPRGSQVIPAAQTSNMMGGFGGSIEVFGVLRGQDIFFSNKKYGQTYGRTT